MRADDARAAMGVLLEQEEVLRLDAFGAAEALGWGAPSSAWRVVSRTACR